MSEQGYIFEFDSLKGVGKYLTTFAALAMGYLSLIYNRVDKGESLTKEQETQYFNQGIQVLKSHLNDQSAEK